MLEPSATLPPSEPATSQNPCSICGKEKRCRKTVSGLALCWNESAGAIQEKTDRQGVTYWVHHDPTATNPTTATGGKASRQTPPASAPQATAPATVPVDPVDYGDVYESLLKHCELSKVHRDALRERGPKHEEITTRGYGSLPAKSRYIVEQMIKEYGEEKLLSVPGFVRRTNRTTGEDYVAICSKPGLLIPCRDVFGCTIAIQVRVDEDDGKGKYRYFSSSVGKNKGPGAVMLPHVPYSRHSKKLISRPCETIRITEGPLKADIATDRDESMPTIGLPGISNWRKVIDVLKHLQVKRVHLASDADCTTNPEVAHHTVQCHSGLIEAGFEVLIETWPLAVGKGIDNLLAAGGKPEVLTGDATSKFLQQLSIVAATPKAAKSKKPDAQAVVPAEVRNKSEDRWTDIRCDEGKTDIAFSRRFLKTFGDRVHWVPAWKSWLVWDETRWKIDEGRCAVTLFCQAISDSVWHEAVEVKTGGAIRFAFDMAKPSRWESALKAAAAERAVAVSDLNANRWLLNCPNGTVDLRTGELRPHRKEDLLTTLCPTPFNPEAESYQWDRFLDGVFPSQPMKDYLQRLVGYAVAGRAAKAEEILPILWGDGSNGKTKFTKAIQDTLGEDFAMMGSHGLLTERQNERHATERASLYGKRLVLCSETGHGDALDEPLVKSLTGGDRVRARFMHKDEFEFDPTFTIFMITNAKPRIRGNDHGIWRRVCLIPWTVHFWSASKGESGPPELEADIKIEDKLAAERPGILAWIVAGCLAWQRDGFRSPEEVQVATREYRSAEDTIGQFVSENCTEHPSATTKFSCFIKAYESWCLENGERPMGGKRVGSWLQKRGYKRFMNNGTWYEGIMLETF